MTIPVWLVLLVGAVLLLAVLITILAMAAWWGLYLENNELRERLHIIQIDVTGLDGDPLYGSVGNSRHLARVTRGQGR